MVECKPIETLMASNSLHAYDDAPLSDPTSYRRLVESLQYLTMTRSDLTYSVNAINQLLVITKL